jgi:Baseplate J-like protein
VLPIGLQFQSKPAPGQPPQTFELAADTPIGPPDQVPATPPPVLLAEIGSPASRNFVRRRRSFLPMLLESATSFHAEFFAAGTSVGQTITAARPHGAESLLLRGAVDGIDPGALLLLRPRDSSIDPLLATVKTATIDQAAAGGQQTRLTITLSDTPPIGMTAAQAKLEQANQSASLWSFFSGAVSGKTVHLASLVRQIRPDDWMLFTRPSHAPVLAQVTATNEAIWDATGSGAKPTTPADTNHPVPIPHTVLTLATALPFSWNSAASSVTVRFGWVSAGTLSNQPFGPWTGAPTTLLASSAQTFPAGSGYPILLQDATSAGTTATGSSVGDTSLLLGALPSPVPPLQPPFIVLPNLLPVTRGKTVTNEVLGSGDATSPAQSFQLKQSPVTYLQQGATWASTIRLTVGGQPWTEVASFYGQPADATVFVTFEDDAGMTHVMFGDGVNGARLPTGTNNVVATYRTGAGAASPAAGKLTVIAQSYPGLRAVLNPVPVGGGADPDPPDQVRRYALRSVLTFGRAVSVFDYEALAALVPGVTRASAVWAWNEARQRALVTVYVGDDAAAAAAAKSALAAAGDPNRPVQVVLATPVAVALTLSLTITAGMDSNAVGAGVAAALADRETGLFGAVLLAIGRPVFDSQIEAAVLAVPGAVAITAACFTTGDTVDPGPLHNPGEGAYYTLDPADITLVMDDAHGG